MYTPLQIDAHAEQILYFFQADPGLRLWLWLTFGSGFASWPAAFIANVNIMKTTRLKPDNFFFIFLLDKWLIL
jgi:hypothetical protein